MHERHVMSVIKTVLLQGHSLARSPGSSTSVLIITPATPASGLDEVPVLPTKIEKKTET
jgi:hypothetical protein